MFDKCNGLFDTGVPYRFRLGLVNAGRGSSDSGSGPGGSQGPGDSDSGDSGSNGSDGGGGDRGAGLGGATSGGMSPDAKESSKQSGYGNDGSTGGSIGNNYGGSWEGNARDRANGYAGAKGYGVGGTGTNDGKTTMGDMDGLGLVGKVKVGASVVADNPYAAIGTIAGGLLAGLPGLGLGAKIGGVVDKARAGWSPKAIAKNSLGKVAGSAISMANPVAGLAYDAVAKMVDPSTKLSSHALGMVGTAVGMNKLGPVGGLIGANVGMGLGSVVPGGSMNPSNGDMSTADTAAADSSSVAANDGSGNNLDATASTALGGATKDITDRLSNIRNANQRADYEKRFHTA